MKWPTDLSSMTAAVLQFGNSGPYKLLFKYKQLTVLVAKYLLWKCLYLNTGSNTLAVLKHKWFHIL